MEFKAQQIAQLIGGTVDGNPECVVTGVSKIEEGKMGTLTFFANQKYEKYVYSTDASVIIVNKDFVPAEPIKATLIRVDDAYQSLAVLLEMYENMQPQKSGVEQPSFINESATIGEFVYVGAFSYISEKVKIGTNSKIHPQVFLGDNVKIGENTIIYPGVKVYKNCVIGNNCVIHAGAVIGGDGFGFAPDANNEYKKVSQIGNVVIEDNVEIGSNTTIDRATMGSTIIRRGAKLDNLIQIAHNVEVGENTVIAAQTGVAGSTKIGRNCMFGGQVGVTGHVTVADGSRFAAQTGIAGAIKRENGVWMGSPAINVVDYQKAYVVFRKLPELKKQVDMLVASAEKNNK